MKKTIAILLSTTAVISSAQVAYSQAEWVEEDVFKYSTYTGAIEKITKSGNTNDTPPAVNTKLLTLTVPDNIDGTDIVSVSDLGFFNYDALEYITLSKNTQYIGEQAFYGCDNLKKIEMPSSIQTIKKACFTSCDALTKVVLNKGIQAIDEQAFMSCKALTTINFPEGLKSIGASAFANSSSLKNVKLPNSLKSLGDSAFKSTAIEQITIPDGLESIPTNAFNGCKSLKKVVINSNITKIDSSAFANCTNLEEVYIPDSCKEIANTAFADCPKVVIHCSAGSAAEKYAQNKKLASFTGDKIDEVEVPDTITVKLDGKPIDFGGLEPVIIDGTTLVPMRPIFTALGTTIDWDAETKTVFASKGVKNISLTIGSKKAKVNNTYYTLDVAGTLIEGSTYVPVRFISEALGVTVNWDGVTQTVNLVS